MINKLKQLFSPKDEKLSQENETENEFLITRIIPKNKLLFGKVISFSFDSNSVQMAASFHLGKKFQILEVHKEYFSASPESKLTVESFYEQCILDFTQKHKSYFLKIYVTVTGETTLYRTLMLPDLNPKDLAAAVQFEVKKNIPFAVEDCIYDFRVIQKFEDLESSRVKVSLHASTKADIFKQLKPFQAHNIKVDKITHSHDSIGQLLGLLDGFSQDKNYTLINIGRKLTEISFYKGSTLEFSRSNILSSDLLGDKSDLTKLEYFAESIANDIQNSLDYYAGQSNVSSNNSILLYGNFAYSEDFIKLLNSKLDFILERFPIEKLLLTINKTQDLESLPVCLPVLATSINNAYLPDLLPTPMKLEIKAHRLNNILKVAAVFLLTALSISWYTIKSEIEQLRAQDDSLQNQISLFKKSEAFHTYKVIKQEIALDKLYINLAKESPSYLHLNLKELSKITPENIQLFLLDYNPINESQNYLIQGIARSKNIPPEISLAEFIENLSSSPFYENVEIVRHVKKKKKSLFEIEFLVKMKGVIS